MHMGLGGAREYAHLNQTHLHINIRSSRMHIKDVRVRF